MDVNVEYLIYNLQDLGMEERKIYELLERLQGLRVYITKQRIFKYRLKKRYYKLKGILPRHDIVSLLAKEFEKSPNRIRLYINKFEELNTSKRN